MSAPGPAKPAAKKPHSEAYRTLIHEALLAVAASTADPAPPLADAAVECVLGARQVVVMRQLPAGAEGAALLRPLLTALCSRGCVAKAAQYALHYGVQSDEPFGSDSDGVERRVDPSDGARYTFTEFEQAYGAQARELWVLAGQMMRGGSELAALVGAMAAQGDYDGIFNLCANTKSERPPHSIPHHHSTSKLLLDGLSQPRFVFDRGVPTSTPMDLRSHLPLLTRWVGAAENFEPVQAVVGALLALTPPALGSAVELQLATLYPKAAKAALAPEQQVSALLPMLAEADPRAALSLLRTWAMAPKPQQKRAKGAVLLGTYTEPEARMAERGWAMADLGGVTAAGLIQSSLRPGDPDSFNLLWPRAS